MRDEVRKDAVELFVKFGETLKEDYVSFWMAAA